MHALITGATGGLGRAIVDRLLTDGVSLTMLARDATALTQVAEEVRRGGGPAVATVTCDLSDRHAVMAAARALADSGRSPDIVVNNAAVQGPIGPFERVEWDEWERTITIDLLAPALLTQILLPPMVRRGWGRIINISGGGATAPRPHFSAYGVAKCALVRLTETLAVELKGSGVTVNAVAPGAMNTRMLDEVVRAGPDASTEYAGAVERQRGGGQPPERAAALVSWLASTESDGITGRLISAVWDPWTRLADRREELASSDIYTLRRIVPADRGKTWGEP